MGWSRLQLVSLAAALTAAAACTRPPLESEGTGSVGRDGGSLGRTPGGSSGGSSAGSSGLGGFAGGQSCARYILPTSRPVPDVLILMDASGSMNDDLNGMQCSPGCGAGSKWSLTSAAIETIVSQTNTAVNWGLAWFPAGGGGFCGVSVTPSVPVSPENSLVVMNAIAGRFPGGSTPMRLAVAAAAASLNALTDNNRKLILLATDGASNCVPGNSNTLADDTAAAIDAIASAAAQGLPTLVLGIAPAGGPADAALDQMAAAGGLPRPGSPAYYPLSQTSELVATLKGLNTALINCVFDLPVQPTNDGTTSRQPFVVSVDGVPIPFDTTHTDGWDYTAPTQTQIQLYGPPCATVMNDPSAHTLAIDFFCPGD